MWGGGANEYSLPPERESTQERAMKRTFIMVLDSFGIGASADAKKNLVTKAQIH